MQNFALHQFPHGWARFDKQLPKRCRVRDQSLGGEFSECRTVEIQRGLAH